MKGLFRYILTLSTWVLTAFTMQAQICNPVVVYTDSTGNDIQITTEQGYSGSAPLRISCTANPDDNMDTAWKYEWHFFNETDPKNEYLIRYEENTEITFNEAGSFRIYLYTIKNDTIKYGPYSVSISESQLYMPNAFSPNGDGKNDIYRPKPGYKSIVDFKAYIFNRWGQKLYEWTDPSTGWDGTYRGKPVAQGVYYCLVKAKGADGRQFNIKRDVNLLRGYTETIGGEAQQ